LRFEVRGEKFRIYTTYQEYEKALVLYSAWGSRLKVQESTFAKRRRVRLQEIGFAIESRTCMF